MNKYFLTIKKNTVVTSYVNTYSNIASFHLIHFLNLKEKLGSIMKLDILVLVIYISSFITILIWKFQYFKAQDSNSIKVLFPEEKTDEKEMYKNATKITISMYKDY